MERNSLPISESGPAPRRFERSDALDALCRTVFGSPRAIADERYEEFVRVLFDLAEDDRLSEADITLIGLADSELSYEQIGREMGFKPGQAGRGAIERHTRIVTDVRTAVTERAEAAEIDRHDYWLVTDE